MTANQGAIITFSFYDKERIHNMLKQKWKQNLDKHLIIQSPLNELPKLAKDKNEKSALVNGDCILIPICQHFL